jgi:hypothetical protein
MMKFILLIVATALLSAAVQMVLPWWSLVIAAALAGALFSLSAIRSFAGGFLGIAAVWWCYAWMIDVQNESLLSQKIATLFHIGSPALLIIASGALAGVIGGLAAVSGSEIRRLF